MNDKGVILLTGGSGFVGKNVNKRLREEGYKVYAPTSEVWDLRSQLAVQDMLNRLNGDIVAIVHLAGTVGGIGANEASPARFMYENLIMGANLINGARCYLPHAKFINVGTVCAYPKYTLTPFREADLWKGYPEETNAPYGIAKKTLMKMVEVYNDQYNFRGVNLLPVNMYGPEDHFNKTTSHVIPALIVKFQEAIDKGRRDVYLWGSGRASREFLYVDDFATAVHKAIITDVSGEPINIGTGSEITIKALAEKIQKIVGFEGEIHWDLKRPDGQPRRNLSTTRARERLGFEATTDLDTGLQKTVDWYKNMAIFYDGFSA